MKTRKPLYLVLFFASTSLSPALLSTSQLPLLAHVDACQHCSAQLISPSISLSQLFF